MSGREGNTHLTTDRTRHYRDCPECQGAGEITVNTSGIGDPQCEEPAPCPNPKCFHGQVIEWEDPLILMRQSRRSSWYHPAYNKARVRAMAPADLPLDFCISQETADYFNNPHRNVVMDVLGPAFAQMFGRAA